MHSLVKIHCDDNTLYKNKDVIETIEYIFNHHEIVTRKYCHEQVGKGYSTCDLNSAIVLEMPGLQKLIYWIAERQIEYSSEFTSKKVQTVKFERAWLNRMFKGCEVQSHTYKYFDGVVSIFYFDVPENSAKFLVENDEIEVSTGNLIMHDSKLPHAVSKHMNDSPRTCIIFETIYE